MSCWGRVLAEALRAKDQQKAQQALARSAPLDEANEVGDTPLLTACQEGFSDLAQDLISRRADLQARDLRRRWTPLHRAAARGDLRLSELLLTGKAEAEAAGREGESAVHLASLLGHEEVVKALLQAGASANLAALDGKTALSHACYRGHLQVARSLLQHRARCDVVDRGQRSPLHWAAETGQEALLDILLPCSLDAQDLQGWTPLMATAQQGHVATARRLLEGKASLEPQGLDGETAVMLAALNGHIEMLRLLVIHRADLNQPAGDGMTPLKLAGEAGHAEAVQRLLAMGAEVPPEGLALKGQADSSDELALTASLARQLSAELKSAATLEAADALARRWGFDDAQRLLGAVSAAEAHELEAHLSLLKGTKPDG